MLLLRSCLVLIALILLSCSSESRLDEADRLQRSGRIEESEALLREVLNEDPNDARANIMYGVSLNARGQSSMAVFPLRRAYQLTDEEPSVGLAYARALIRAGDSRTGTELVTELLERDPAMNEARALRIDANLAAMKHEEALEDIAMLEEEFPESVRYRNYRIRALIGLARIEEIGEAIRSTQALVDRHREQAQESGDEVSAAGAQGAQLHFCALASMFASESGTAEEARATYESCLERYPHEPKLMLQAVSFFDAQGDFERSNGLIQAAAEANPDSRDFNSMWSARLLALGRADEAEVRLIDFAGDDPGLEDLAELATLYGTSKQYRKAADVNLRIIKAQEEAGLGPPNPLLWANYLDMLIESGQPERARAELSKLSSPYLELIEGKLLFLDGQPANALETLDRALQVWPDQVTARYYAGQAAEQLGDFDRATEEYEAGLRQDKGASLTALPLLRIRAAAGEQRALLFVVNQMLEAGTREAEAYRLGIRASQELGRLDVVQQLERQWSKLPGQLIEFVLDRAARTAQAEGPEAARRVSGRILFDYSQPENVDALMAWVDYSIQAGALESSLAWLETQIEQAPAASGLHEAHAVLLAETEGVPPEIPLAALDRAIALGGGERHQIWLTRGNLQRGAGDWEGALSSYREAAQRDPDSILGRWDRFAILEEQRGAGSAEAREELEELLRAEPKHAQAALALSGIMLADQEPDLDRVLDLTRRAARFGGGATAAARLSEVHLRRGEPGRALAVSEQAATRWPEVAVGHLWRARALAALGRSEEARLAYEKVVGFGDFEGRDAALEELRALAPSTDPDEST